MQIAGEEYRKFHWGRPARKIRRAKVAPPPEVLTEIGTIESIVYSTKKGKEPLTDFEHHFGEEGGRKPTLAFDPKNKRLHVVGGSYKVEPRGIVD